MKIKKKEYHNLLKLKKENYDLNLTIDGLSVLLGDRTFDLRAIREQRDRILLNFGTKICLVGKRGSGKTNFIKKILPSIKNYFIYDINNEYKEVDDKNKFFITKSFNRNSFINQIKNNKDKTIILEDISAVLCPIGLRWLFDALEGYNYIFVYQQFNQIQNIVNNFDYIYDFGTNENDYTCYNFRNTYENKIIQL